MAVSNLRKGLHRKAWEMCTFSPAGATNPGIFVTSDKYRLVPNSGGIMYEVNGVSSIWQYLFEEDGWNQLPNSGITGTFGAGSCGEFNVMGAPGGAVTNTATAGTTTTISTNRTIVHNLKDVFIRVVAGTGIGYEGFIKSNTIGANSVITLFDANGVAFDNTTQFQIFSGSLWFWNASANGFSVYDRATNAWTAKSITNVTASWGTCGMLTSFQPMVSGYVKAYQATASSVAVNGKMKLVCAGQKFYQNDLGRTVRIIAGAGVGAYGIISEVTNASTILFYDENGLTTTTDATSVFTTERTYGKIVNEKGASPYKSKEFFYSTGTNTTTTVNDTTKSWTTNMWANHQARVIWGTGKGQVRKISANTATQLTVATWAVTPDASSVIVIEPDEDMFILSGNNSVAIFKYSISGNAWSTVTPGAARAGAKGAGGMTEWITHNAEWLVPDPTNYRQNDRYMKSLRGGAGSVLDIYDIAANTWISGRSYGNQMETFTTGSCCEFYNGGLYILKEGTGRLFFFDPVIHHLIPITTNPYVESTTREGDKICIIEFQDGLMRIPFLLQLRNNRDELHRMILV